MSCPDWQGPAAPDPAARPDEWDAALRHLDGCARCRRAALRADPTLVFRGLPAPALEPAEESAEVETMRLAVSAMRRVSRISRISRHERAGASRRLGAPARGRASRRSLAAGLSALALLLGGGESLRHAVRMPQIPQMPQVPVALGQSAGAGALSAFPARAGAAGAEGFPADSFAAPGGLAPASVRGSIDELRRPHARVYQIDGPHLSVVMIVDEKLDV